MTRRSEIEVRATSPSSERRNALTVARYLHTQGVTVEEAAGFDLGQIYYAKWFAIRLTDLPWSLVVQKLAALHATQPADAFDRSTGLPGPLPKGGGA